MLVYSEKEYEYDLTDCPVQQMLIVSAELGLVGKKDWKRIGHRMHHSFHQKLIVVAVELVVIACPQTSLAMHGKPVAAAVVVVQRHKVTR
jgi:hypothetical protein